MIHSVKAVNYLGEELLMELRNPERSGFLIFNITGLGPEKAEIRVTDIGTADGGIYNSARLPPRNIVMSIRNYDWVGKSVEEIRHESYKYFPIKKPVTLTITTDKRVGRILGYVEANEPVIFSKETHCQISIICPNPYFYDASGQGKTVTEFAGVYPRFEFPFSNESLTQPLLEMGEIVSVTEDVVPYTGDAEIGVLMIFNFLGEVRNITIHEVDRREEMFIDTDRLAAMTGSQIQVGDKIFISTVKGDIYARLLRNGVTTNILNAVIRGSTWFQLVKGDNIFAIEVESGITNMQFMIENDTIYEGM